MCRTKKKISSKRNEKAKETKYYKRNKNPKKN